MLVGPRGTGKSVVMQAIHRAHGGGMWIDAATQAGLRPLAEEFTNFNGLLLLDDLGKLNTTYRRENTLSTLAELAYSHFVESYTGHHTLSIENFHGSVLMGCQPIVLGPIVKLGTWDATIGDKTLRYYHLRRPRKANLEPLRLGVDWGVDLEDTEHPDLDAELLEALYQTLRVQWSEGRVRLHAHWLLRGAAALDGRYEPSDSDVATLLTLLKPMRVEHYMIDREGIEGNKKVRTDFYYLLSEFMTYGEITAQTLVRDFQISEPTAYRVLNQYRRIWEVVNTQPKVYRPSPALEEIMREVS